MVHQGKEKVKVRIVIEDIEPGELFLLMEGFIKPSDINFGNREALIAKWDKFKAEVLAKGEAVKSEMNEENESVLREEGL